MCQLFGDCPLERVERMADDVYGTSTGGARLRHEVVVFFLVVITLSYRRHDHQHDEVPRETSAEGVMDDNCN